MLTRRMGACPFFFIWSGMCGRWVGAFDRPNETFEGENGALAA